MAYTVRIVDTSKWSGKINFPKMKANGARAMITKGTEGVGYVDPTLMINAEGANENDLPLGLFHFLRANYSGSAQAEFFARTVEKLKTQIEPAADVETFDGQSGAKVLTVARDFCIRLEQIYKKPMIYTSPGLWQSFGGYNSAYGGWAIAYKLWLAHYGVNQPTIPPPWTSFVFWQDNPNGDGKAYGTESAGIDLDWFNGTIIEFNAAYSHQPAQATSLAEYLTSLDLFARNLGFNGPMPPQ